MYTYLRNIGPLFFMEFFFSQKFESLIVSFDGSFRSYLLESYLVILTSMRGMTSTYFFVHKPLSEGLSASPNIFCFLRRGIMESVLCVLVDCPTVWSCLQVFNLGFPWGWGYMEEDLVIYKELFSQRTFGISKLFQKSHFDVCSKQTCSKTFKRFSWIGLHECWKILFCFWWSEVMFDWSKRFKLQFEGFKEPVFEAFICLHE